MKKILALLLVIVSLLGLVACKGEEMGENVTVVDENGVVTTTLAVSKLDTAVAGEVIRTRETAEGTRLLVNSENPLFLFRPSLPIFSSHESVLVSTYNALPEDVREFTVMLSSVAFKYTGSVDDLFKEYDKILDKTDEENIPTIIQIEYWDSADVREPFTEEQLCDLLERHPSLVGYNHVELCCSGFSEEELNRIKTTIKACREYGALFVWQDMEYQWDKHTNTFNRAFEDEELYNLMKDYSHNIIITDKHNGRGRHFSTQSSAMGAWLAGLCDNWGTNTEAWLWWEVGTNDYAESSIEHSGEMFIHRYPPALAGIDTICDLVGGANVYSSEELNIYSTTLTGVKFTETFWSVVYPLYQRVINGAVPEKDDVVEKIKVAYQFTSSEDKYMQGLESDIFIDTYGMDINWYNKYKNTDSTKKWVPSTGRYYIIPFLPKFADAAEILPDADILNTGNYKVNMGLTSTKKHNYLDARYEEFYTGDATLFSIDGLTYAFNNNEFKANDQTFGYAFETSGLDLAATLPIHTYMILEDKADGLLIDLVNLRLDSYDVCVGEKSGWSFTSEYIDGKRMDSEADFRTTTITLSGIEKMPEVKASGNNNPTAEMKYDPSTKEATVTVVSNGKVLIEIVK